MILSQDWLRCRGALHFIYRLFDFVRPTRLSLRIAAEYSLTTHIQIDKKILAIAL